MSVVILAQLEALRAQLDATIALVQATVRPELMFEGGETRAPEDACPHRPERQRDASTFAEPNMVVCLDCQWRRPGALSEGYR